MSICLISLISQFDGLYEGLEVINPEGSTEDAEEEAGRGRWKQELRGETKSQEEKPRRERSEAKDFAPKWFDETKEVTPTPWGDLEVYQFNGNYLVHRTAADSSEDNTDVKLTQFNPLAIPSSLCLTNEKFEITIFGAS